MSLRLAHLPLDVLVQIQSFMDSSDIISLRQTCKSITTATRERTVWLEALRRVCVVNGIFKPTFPLQEMSQRALEHAATSPSRFANFLIKNDNIVHPFATRLLNSRWRGDDGVLEDCCLIPGGRFLISRSSNSVIHMWDLGFTSEAMIKPFPIASMKGAGLQILAIQPTGDNMGIRLLLSSAGLEVDGNSINVYEVYPLSTAPTFTMVATLQHLDHPPEVFSSAQDLIAIHHHNFVTVWNFVLDSIVTWDASMEYAAMKLFTNHIILLDIEWFTLWNIPPLQSSAEPIVPSQTPVWTFSHPHKGGYDRISIPSSPWPQDACRPIYFNLSANDGVRNVIAYYMMTPVVNQHDNGIPSLIPVLMTSAETSGFDGGDLYGDMRVCDNWLIQPWVEDERMVVNMTKIPRTRREDTPTKTLLLWASHRSSDSLQCFDFCPISGRLCCSVDDNGYEIRVMDYIVPH